MPTPETATGYESRALERLELPKVLSRLEALCACDLGRTLVKNLVPTPKNALARERLALTTEAKRFIDEIRFPPFGGLRDLTAEIKSAAIGVTLDPIPLQNIGRAAEGIRRLRDVLWNIGAEKREEYPRLMALCVGLISRPDLEKAISDAIDDNGEIRDDASLDLLKARRNIRQTQNSIQTRLRQMLSDSRITPHLQDAFVTMRDGRYCLPVKAESRGSVPGIVHDRSGSGAALFIEPQAVVELNNRLRELAGEEKEAILEVLKGLSAHVGGCAGELSQSLDVASWLDFGFAKAQLSIDLRAIEPVLRDDVAGYYLESARHPLVENCIANDIRLGADSAVTERGDFDTMMLTGPNTGGKTVVLKTLGLLAAMVACGLHIPVEERSWLSLPGQIHVDIGDEQSIEQSLSTFSGHLKNIVGILRTVQENDLVLFDEIGAGTDPDEGAALAKAVLRVLSRRGAKVVATTHYGELKQFALSAQRFENASVEFDPKTLRPTYHLRIGVPGASNALDIAARLGMPNDIVSRARRYLGSERVEAEAAAQRLEETQRELTQQTVEARRERSEVEKLKRDYEKRLQKIERDTHAEVEKARREARELVEAASKEADEALKELRRAAREGGGRSENKGTEEARGRLRNLRERVVNYGDGQTSGIEQERISREERARQKQVSSRPLHTAFSSGNNARVAPVLPKIGDLVKVKTLDREGEVLSVAGERIEVRVGAMKITVNANDLAVEKAKGGVSGAASIAARKGWAVEDEINLIGQTTEEALENLAKYMDDAILAELPSIRIVHGRGSGALRSAVHRYLRGFGNRVDFDLAPQNEGGEGATVVKLG